MKTGKLITITLEARNNKVEIKLPENYSAIFEKASSSTEYHEKRLYNRFVEKFLDLQEFEREMFEDIANSGKHPVETMGDLIKLFDAIFLYFTISNVENYAELGSLYASMNHLTFVGDRKNVDMDRKYAELGKAVCEMSGGFFVGDKFYGRRK